MKHFKNYFTIIFLFFLLFFANTGLHAQDMENQPRESRKQRKEMEKSEEFSRTDSLINSRQFVFESTFGQESDLTFILADSIYGEVQNGNRRNLEGEITKFEVNKNEKKQTISVEIRIRAVFYVADIVLFLDSYGEGRATVKSEFPGNFSFDGSVQDFESSSFHEAPPHLVK